jgi:hypothetical protein
MSRTISDDLYRAGTVKTSFGEDVAIPDRAIASRDIILLLL